MIGVYLFIYGKDFYLTDTQAFSVLDERNSNCIWPAQLIPDLLVIKALDFDLILAKQVVEAHLLLQSLFLTPQVSCLLNLLTLHVFYHLRHHCLLLSHLVLDFDHLADIGDPAVPYLADSHQLAHLFLCATHKQLSVAQPLTWLDCLLIG